MPRDNLLNSACLELFEFIKKESIKQLIIHLVETYRERLMGVTYVDTFQNLVQKYDQLQGGYNPGDETSFSTQGPDTPNRGIVNGGQRWQGLKESDADEEAYFNTSDGEDDGDASLPTAATVKGLTNGTSPARPLVAYPDDDDDAMDLLSASTNAPIASSEVPSATSIDGENNSPRGRDRTPVALEGSPGAGSHSPPERLSEKRRREEEDDDDLDLLQGVVSRSFPAKRRTSSTSSVASALANSAIVGAKPELTNGEVPARQNGPSLRRKGSLRSKDGGVHKDKGGAGAISISLKASPGAQGDGNG